MAISHHLTEHDDQFAALRFIPVGKKSKQVRSVGHKYEKGLFTRLNEMVSRLFHELTPEQQATLARYLFDDEWLSFPVPILHNEKLYPHLFTSDAFLWQYDGQQHGIPLHPHRFQTSDYRLLTNDELEANLRTWLQEALFCATLPSEAQLLTMIEAQFSAHPFMQLYAQYEETIAKIEAIKTHSLLFYLANADDVNHWRERIEIVLRPFRAIPLRAFEREEPQLHVQAKSRLVTVTFPTMNVTLHYDAERQAIVTLDELDVALYTKRMATITRQFEELFTTQQTVLTKISQLTALKARWLPHVGTLREIEQLYETAALARFNVFAPEQNEWVVLLQALIDCQIQPLTTPYLHSIGQLIFPIELMRHVDQLNELDISETGKWLKLARQAVMKAINEPVTTTYLISKAKIARGDILTLLYFIQANDTVPKQYVAKILRGQISTKLRQLRYDLLPGVHELAHLSEKTISDMLQFLIANGLVTWVGPCYRLTPDGDKLVQLLRP